MAEDVLAKIPNTIVFTSEYDFLRRDAIKFIGRLKKVGKCLDYFSMPGAMHNYEGFDGDKTQDFARVIMRRAWQHYVMETTVTDDIPATV